MLRPELAARRLERLTEESDGIKQKIQERKESIIDSGAMIKRFEEQQNSVRNNREFESLNKEIEYQSLEIQLSEKRIKEAEIEALSACPGISPALAERIMEALKT